METLLAATVLIVVFGIIMSVQAGPASNVPERYDKAVVIDLRKWLIGFNSQGRFERQVS